MAFSDITHSYDPETLAILTEAFNTACEQFQRGKAEPVGAADFPTTRKLMALRIMEAANAGERDVDVLTAVALRAVEGREFG